MKTHKGENKMISKKLKPLYTAGAIFILLLSTGCSSNEPSAKTHEKAEQSEPYRVETKDVKATITDIEKEHRFALTHRYRVTTKIRCDEYNFDDTFVEEGSGILGAPISWDFEVGDTVEAKIELTIDNKTDSIVSHEIVRFL